MGREASLRLLNLPPDASIDDANKAYATLHKELQGFHQGSNEERRGDFQEDIELLTCAYETAVVCLSEKDSPSDSMNGGANTRPSMIRRLGPTEHSMTAKQDSDARWDRYPNDISTHLPADHRTVEEAISITSRRLRETESVLPGARQAVEAAKKAMEKANRRIESAKHVNLNAIVSAKSAKIRALLLDLEAKKAEKSAHAVAEKAREKALTARKAADKAKDQADQIKEKVIRAKKSEEAAIAEVVCAEDRMEREVVRLRQLEHKLLETRNCMRMFRETTATLEREESDYADCCPVGAPKPRSEAGKKKDGEAVIHEQILSELQNVEVVDDIEAQKTMQDTIDRSAPKNEPGPKDERRQHIRIAYPADRHPHLLVDSRPIPILDLSAQGMRLEPADGLEQNIVRGSIDFPGGTPLNVIGRVIRKDPQGMGIKLVTRIGKQVLDRERHRLVVHDNHI